MLEKLSKVNSWIKKNKVLDVVLFGSSARMKSKPGDIDLCILIQDKDDAKSLDLVDSLYTCLQDIKSKVQINILSSREFTGGNSLARTILLEGISLKTKKKVSEIFGFQSKSIFLYSLSHFTPSERVRFHYALKGRYGSEGMLTKVEGEFWNMGTIVVSTSHEDLLKEFLVHWKVVFQIKRGLIS